MTSALRPAVIDIGLSLSFGVTLGGRAGMSSSAVTTSSVRGPRPRTRGNIAKRRPTPAEIAPLAGRNVAGGWRLRTAQPASAAWQIEDAPRPYLAFLDLCQRDQRALGEDRHPAADDGRIAPPQQHRLPAREAPGIAWAHPQRRQCRDPGLDRQEARPRRDTVPAGADPLQCVQTRGDVFAERADRRAAQRRDMPEALERAAEVASERAHVSSLAALGHEHRVIGIGRLDQFEAMNLDWAWGDIYHLAVAREVVGALAGDFHRREARRHLRDLAGEAR